MGNKSLEYRQISIRIPPKFFEKIQEMARELSTTIQDTILIILKEYFDMIEEGE